MAAAEEIIIGAADKSLGLIAEAAELALDGLNFAARNLTFLNGDEGVPKDAIMEYLDD